VDRPLVFDAAAVRVARDGQCGERVARRLEHGDALRGEAQRRRVPVDQRGAGPGLERADAAPERRVRDMAALRCPHEAAGLGEREQVFEPFELHPRPLGGAILT
jgi:hypothetical protein